MSALERLSTLLLVTMSARDSARACVDAIAAGRNLRARLHRLRLKLERLRRAVKRVSDITIPDTGEALELVLSYRLGLVDIAASCGHVLSWIDAQDVKSDDLLADKLVGVCWRRDRDPVLLAGAGMRGLALALVQRGVERVILVDADLREDELPGVFAIPDTSHVHGALLQYTANRPHELLRYRGDGVPDDEWATATAGAEDALTGVRLSSNTIDVFGQVWVEQGCANYPIIARSPKISAITRSHVFAGKPMVIVATGPSLDKNVHLLKQIKGHAIIATFSHTLRALQKAGVVPDLVLALDPEDLRYHFEGYDTTQPEALLLGATIHPGAMRLPAKRLFTFAPNCLNDSWIHGMWDAMIPTGGSVACTTLGLGVQWGCDPIVFIGQDLAYTGNQVYAQGSVDDQTVITTAADGTHRIGGWSKGYQDLATIRGQAEKQEAIEYVKAWDGQGLVPTSDLFCVYRRWIETVAKNYRERCRVYNCTEGGAYMDGATHVTLASMLPVLTTQDVDVGSLLDRAQRSHDPRNSQEQALADITSKVVDLERAELLARECLTLAHAVVDVIPPRLVEAGTELQAQIAKLRYVILANQGQLSRYDEIDPDDGEAANECCRENYALVAGSADKLLPILRRSRDEIRDALAQVGERCTAA